MFRTTRGWKLIIVLGCAAAALPGAGRAEEEGRRWGVSPLLGVHSPALKLLNRGEFAAPLPGRGRIVFEDTGDNVDFDFVIDNSLPPVDFGTEAGVEFQLALGPRDHLLLGFSSWEGAATAVVGADIPFQGKLTRTAYERSANISYFQYFLGWRHDLLQRPNKSNLYTRLTLHEVFDIDYRENLVFAFAVNPTDTFKRIIVMESQATGVLMLQLGLGGEVFLRRWISLGFDAGYTAGVNQFELGNADLKTDLMDSDFLDMKLPTIRNIEGNLVYLSRGSTFANADANYRPLKLDFDGWRALVRVNFYF